MLTLAAPQDEPSSVPMTVVLIVAIIAGIIYVFGYLRAVMHRANSDYKKTKAILPTMRKDFWRAWWGAVKIGFWVLVAFFILGAWAFNDVSDDDPQPTPATVSSPARR